MRAFVAAVAALAVLIGIMFAFLAFIDGLRLNTRGKVLFVVIVVFAVWLSRKTFLRVNRMSID